MRLKVKTDGTPGGTRVYDPVTNREVEGIVSISFHLGVNSGGNLLLEIAAPMMEFEGECEATNESCDCDIQTLMATGCQCGKQ